MELYQIQHFQNLFLYLLLVHLLLNKAKCYVVKDCHVREKGITLKHRVDMTLVGRKIVDQLPVEENVSGRGLCKSADDAKSCCFTATGRPEKSDEFLIVDVEIDAFENLLVIKDHNDILELNNYAFFQISTSVKKRK